MIVPLLQGGLGNQMFQIANAYAYSLRHNFNFGINYGLSHCPNQGFTASRYRDTLYKNIPFTDFIPSNAYNEPFYRYNPIPKNDNIMLVGYYQSEKYFEDFSNQVKNLFTFPQEIIDTVETFIKNINPNGLPLLGIHIRRGDYLKFKSVHAIKGSDYYLQASKILNDKYNVVVCSDDWNTVNQELKFKYAISSPFVNELEDLYFLSRCDALILCNSSFSWWASYLTKDNKKVIAPKIWFAEEGPQDYQDVFRKDWVLL